MGSTPTVSSFIKFIIGVEGGEPNRPRGLSEVRARREQRAKPILLVAKPQKAKCEDPFNANDSRHSHRLHHNKKEIYYSLFFHAKIPHHVGFGDFVRISKTKISENFSVIFARFSFRDFKEFFCD